MSSSVPYKKLPLWKKIYLRLMYQPYYFFMSCYYTLYWASEGCHPKKIDFDGGPLILTRLETIKGIFRRNNSRAWFKIDDYQYSDKEMEEMLNECFSGKS